MGSNTCGTREQTGKTTQASEIIFKRCLNGVENDRPSKNQCGPTINKSTNHIICRAIKEIWNSNRKTSNSNIVQKNIIPMNERDILIINNIVLFFFVVVVVIHTNDQPPLGRKLIHHNNWSHHILPHSVVHHYHPSIHRKCSY